MRFQAHRLFSVVEANLEYAVAEGDRLLPSGTAPVQVMIRHEQEMGLRFVTLLEGSAALLRGVE